jgi:1-pyrroline-5-carboxylate dehydrogenase
MGNVVLWKPSPTQQLAAHFTMRLLEEAGLPLGVANLLTGNGIAVSDVVLVNPEFTGLHFTGSTATFQLLWRTIAETGRPTGPIPGSVGETGGKDFVVAYPSADPDVLGTALIRGGVQISGTEMFSRVQGVRTAVGVGADERGLHRRNRIPADG